MSAHRAFPCENCPSDDEHVRRCCCMHVRWAFFDPPPSESIIISKMLEILSTPPSIWTVGEHSIGRRSGRHFVDVIIFAPENTLEDKACWTADEIEALGCPEKLRTPLNLALSVCGVKLFGCCPDRFETKDFMGKQSVLEFLGAHNYGASVNYSTHNLTEDKFRAWATATISAIQKI